MAAFSPERRMAENRTMIPPSGDRRRNRHLDPRTEDAYWRENYAREPYFERGYTFDDYRAGFLTGWEGRIRYAGRSFDQAERDMRRDYARNRGDSRLDWAKNRHAARAAWERIDDL